MPQNSKNHRVVTIKHRLIYKKEVCAQIATEGRPSIHPVCKQADDTVDGVVLNSYKFI